MSPVPKPTVCSWPQQRRPGVLDTLDWIAFQAYLACMDEKTTSNDPNISSESQARAEYRKARRDYAAVVLRAKRVSRGAAGIRSETAQHYWASVLFTRMVVTSMSIQVLTPDLQPEAHWDFGAVATIARTLAECYLFFYFLCADDVSQVEKDARIILLNLHDNASRGKLFAELGKMDDNAETTAAKAEVHDDLVRKFNANTYLAGLPEKRRKELVRGDKTPFVQDDIIERARMEKRTSASYTVGSVAPRTLVRLPSFE
jgi:hypothetical protein